MSNPLLRFTNVSREYVTGEHVVTALKNVNVTIDAGEFVAIIGPSGSGKSTMMNILGCLDKPTKGTYEVAGRDVANLTRNELAALRREHFGFIFQRYHLLTDLNAQGNVEVPAVYAGWARGKRHQRSKALLERLGLQNRMDHRPNQLSGGQQQRVSVARALMNGGEIILADEPTGALDSRSGEEMLRILDELSAEGHTVIIVTHDPHVASHARRVIEIRDGEIVSDQKTDRPAVTQARALPPINVKESWTAMLDRPGEAFRMAVAAMNAHKLRTFLTMLGIIIGIASVVSIVALGAGSQQAILDEIQTMGSNTITISPGRSAGDPRAADIHTLIKDDMDALAEQPYVDSVTPTVIANAQMRRGSVTVPVIVNGVGQESFRVRGVTFAMGRGFDDRAVESYAQEVVLDDLSAQRMFPEGDPLGRLVIIDGVPFTVIGVTPKSTGTFFGTSSDLQVWAPYTTVTARLTGAADLRSITVRMTDGSDTATVEDSITRLLTTRHNGVKDFFLVSSDSVRRTVESVTLMLSLLIGAIGGISLMVGGLGVMNIMLVSVSERTKEIGVRTAIGARGSDIMSQFIIEAVLVCLIGGALGVGLALLLGQLFGAFVTAFPMIYSTTSIVAAFIISTMIGLVFGWLPARSAARLDPIDALARE